MTRIGAGLSTEPGAPEAGREAADQAGAALGRAPVDLAFCFLSPAHLEDAEEAVTAVEESLRPRHLVSCVADGVVAGARELEAGPGAAVWAASLPGAEVECFHLSAIETETEIAVTGFPRLERPSVVTFLADPFTFPVAPFLTRLNDEHPALPLVGGIAAGGGEPEAQALIVDGELHAHGAVGVVVSGTPVVTAVSQGCAPIGRDSVVTRAEGNVIHELAGTPALERLQEEVELLAPSERVLAARGLLVGLVIDENKPEYGRGDYLMRAVLGADEESGAIAIGDQVRVGQTVRFHVRDASSADEDLRETLDRTLRGGDPRPAGALLFTCNGRGTQMFPAPDHDASLVSEALGGRPVAGFFCGGEIGPIGDRAFLHGFTATLAVFLGQ
jgi:small ligand-binding sensory domain FIST